jgi:hypothetical protein
MIMGSSRNDERGMMNDDVRPIEDREIGIKKLLAGSFENCSAVHHFAFLVPRSPEFSSQPSFSALPSGLCKPQTLTFFTGDVNKLRQ